LDRSRVEVVEFVATSASYRPVACEDSTVWNDSFSFKADTVEEVDGVAYGTGHQTNGST
jgi:hypothetical protein